MILICIFTSLNYLLIPNSLLRFIYCFQDELDPFSLVADELSLLGNRLRAMVVAEVSDCS